MEEDLTETEDQRAFAEAAQRSFESCKGLTGEGISRRLADDGFIGMLAASQEGGLGQGLRAACPVLSAAGRNLLPFPLAEAMLATRVVTQQRLPVDTELMTGSCFATIAWTGEARIRGGAIEGSAGSALLGDAARWLLLPTCDDSGMNAALIDLRGPGVELRKGLEFDLERRDADIVLKGAPIVAVCEGVWPSLARDGAILRAADMIGAAEVSLRDTCAYASTRRQFGKPLSALQAVSTSLARNHFELLTAELSVRYAAFAADHDLVDRDVALSVATSVATQACISVAENAVQIHGAIGFTWDLPLHRRLRRIRAQADVGSAYAARARLADTLLTNWIGILQ